MNPIRIKTPPFLDRALCVDHNPDLWHPRDGNVKNVRRALAICRACPVRVACFEWAMTEVEQFGVYGGTTAEERKAIRRQRLSTATSPDQQMSGDRVRLEP